jgi:hypothetical protein
MISRIPTLILRAITIVFAAVGRKAIADNTRTENAG